MKKTSATLGAVQCRVFVGGNKRGDDATLVLGQFSPLVDKRGRQGAGPVGRDRSGGTLVRASPSPARDTWQGTLGKGHLQGTLGKGHQWQWDGLPQNIPPLLLCSPLHNQSIGCTGGEIKTENVLTNPEMIMDQAGPRRRLVRRRKNLPPAPAHPHHLHQVPPQPQPPQRLLKPDNLSNDSQHLKVLCNILLLLILFVKVPQTGVWIQWNI